MSNLTMLRSYAQKEHPESLPLSILFNHTEKCLTVFDAFPKSMFHFLVLPRIRPPWRASQLTNLRSLLKCDKARAKEVLQDMSEEAANVKKMICKEMQQRYGFQWDIWIGFHPVPSMEHIHLHVLSNDLCSPKMKNKKHYNSFHPEHGFFLHLDDVLSWFDAVPSYFETMSQLKQSEYEPLLKEDLSCWRCGRDMKNMPTLKAHLQEEWDEEARKERARIAKKRKRDGPQQTSTESTAPPSKRRSPSIDG